MPVEGATPRSEHCYDSKATQYNRVVIEVKLNFLTSTMQCVDFTLSEDSLYTLYPSDKVLSLFNSYVKG